MARTIQTAAHGPRNRPCARRGRAHVVAIGILLLAGARGEAVASDATLERATIRSVAALSPALRSFDGSRGAFVRLRDGSGRALRIVLASVDGTESTCLVHETAIWTRSLREFGAGARLGISGRKAAAVARLRVADRDARAADRAYSRCLELMR
jgi:hypothetical protein